MATTLTLGNITIELEPEDIIVTEVEQDEEGYYIREFRFYGEAASEGGANPLVCTVRAKSMTATKVEVTAPEQEF